MADSKSVGLKMKQIRLARGARLQETAKKAGLSTNKLHRIEEGESRIEIEALVAIANALEVSTAELMED